MARGDQLGNFLHAAERHIDHHQHAPGFDVGLELLEARIRHRRARHARHPAAERRTDQHADEHRNELRARAFRRICHHHHADKRADAGRSVVANPYIYALSIAVYCTAWTFFGSVGRASASGIDFLPIYLGPMLVALLWWHLTRKILRISKSNRITSIADFVASRYGKSALLGGVVTVIAVIGILPYISLQLKAISSSFTILLQYPDIVMPSTLGAIPLLQDTALWVALILAAFTILFGTRHLYAAEHHEGMVAAIAFESLVKLVAFIAVGVWVSWSFYDGFGDIFQRAATRADLAPMLSPLDGIAGSYSSWAWLTVLSMLAIMFLPRQFQVAVIENKDENHLKKAIWLFPLYMLAINVFVLPIAFGGRLAFPDGGVDADTFVLTLPMAQKQELLALIVFIGGLSAATGMVIVETIALSTMVCNDLLMPVLLRLPALRLNERSDLTGLLLDPVLDLLRGHGAGDGHDACFGFEGHAFTREVERLLNLVHGRLAAVAFEHHADEVQVLEGDRLYRPGASAELGSAGARDQEVAHGGDHVVVVRLRIGHARCQADVGGDHGGPRFGRHHEVVGIGEQDLIWLETMSQTVESRYRAGQATLVEVLQLENERSKRTTQLQTDREQLRLERRHIAGLAVGRRIDAVPRHGVVFKRFAGFRRIDAGRHQNVRRHALALGAAAIDAVELLNGVLHGTERRPLRAQHLIVDTVQRTVLLHGAFTEGWLADNQRAAVILHRRRENFGGGGAEAIDQHHQRAFIVSHAVGVGAQRLRQAGQQRGGDVRGRQPEGRQQLLEVRCLVVFLARQLRLEQLLDDIGRDRHAPEPGRAGRLCGDDPFAPSPLVGVAYLEEGLRLRQHGVHAFLVGEAFMRAADPGIALASLFA